MITDKDFMLCKSITQEEVFNYDETKWIAQEKKDGERIIAVVINHDTILINRRGKICNFHFEEIVEDLKVLDDCIIDGEMISLDDNFTQLQRRALTKDRLKLKQLQIDIPVKFMVFDILAINGVSKQDLITHKPLKDRIIILNQLFNEKNLKHTELLEYGNIKDMYEKAKENSREGIVIKNLNGIYEGKRSENWAKHKFWNEVDIVFTKYTINPMGIRVETDDGRTACQVAGFQSQEVREVIDKDGQAEITIQYLTKNEETGGYRFPSYKKLVVK